MLIELPFVGQHGETHCGGACLEMIYRKFGVARDQDQIFEEQAVSRPRNPNERYIRTNRLALDARNCGLHAQLFKVQDVAATLRLCDELRVLAILEQVKDLKKGKEIGHFRVVAGLDGQATFNVYDPLLKHRKVFTANELRALSAASPPEVVGNFMVVIGDRPEEISNCHVCGREFPAEISCSKCTEPRKLPFSRLLGCLDPDCSGRVFIGLGCPRCNGEGLTS